MLKKRLFTVFIFVLAMSLVIAGCGSNQAANEALQDALSKSAAIKSASFNGQVELKIDLSNELQSTLTADDEIILNMLKNATLSYTGNYQLEPFQAEVMLTAALPFEGIEMKFDVPVLMTSEKMWIKIPSLPGLNLDGVTGSFVEIDLKQFAEESGETLPLSSEAMQASTKLSNEVYGVFFKHFDETYFKNVDVPNGVNAKKAVEFTITQDQLKNVITLFVEKVMPEVLDILAKPEYASITGGTISADMLAQAKEELTVNSAELDEAINEISQVLNSLTLSAIFGIDNNGFVNYQSMKLSGNITNPDQPGTISFTVNMTQNMSKINESVTFENSFPPANVIPYEELMPFGMYDDFDYDYDYDYDADYEDEDFMDSELIALYEQMFIQDWFIYNEDIINELYETDPEFALDMEDPEIIKALISDPDFRAEFFAYYGVELVE